MRYRHRLPALPAARLRSGRAAGFTLIEILVIVAIVALIAVMAGETLQTYLPRYRFRSTVVQASQLIQRARLQAIQRNAVAVVASDSSDRTLFAYIDRDGNLVFDEPDPALSSEWCKSLDCLVGRMNLPGTAQAGIQFAGPVDGIDGADSVDGFTAAGGWPHNVLVFEPNGAVRDAGAFRFSDNNLLNVLETRVVNIGGKIENRKYNLTTSAFEVEGRGDKSWVWYSK